MVKMTVSDGNRLVEQECRCAVAFLIDPREDGDTQALVMGRGNTVEFLMKVARGLGTLVNMQIEDPDIRDLMTFLLEKKFEDAAAGNDADIEIVANEKKVVEEDS